MGTLVTGDLAPVDSVTHDLGSTLGVYELVSVLGEGGMGRVFLAEHTLLGRQVAIKVLRSEFASDPMIVKRFFAEARTVNQIRHDNIVEITDFVDGDDGTSFIVMEYLQGRSLSQIAGGGPLGIRRAVHIARQIASALGAVHAVEIVHRDLKPDNIILVERPNEPDFVKLLDFGAAKLNPKVVPGSVKTQAITLIGTPQYMSPEQATGAPIDHRSDIYSLGVVLYELVTGGNPFQAADTWSVIRRQVTLEPDRPDTVVSMVPPCPGLADLIMRCLDKDVDGRPNSMAEVEAVLEAIERDLTVRGPSSSRPAQRRMGDTAPPTTLMLRAAGVGPHRGRLRSVLTVLGLAATVGVSGWWLTRGPATAATPVEVEAAAAVASPPVAAPAAPAPVVRSVLLRSKPSGAEVRRQGSEVLLGRTPLTVEIPDGIPSRSYIFTRDGYRAHIAQVASDQPSASVIELERSAPPRKVVERAKRRRVSKAQKAPTASARSEPVVERPAPEAAPPPEPVKAPAPEPVNRNGIIDPFAE